MTAQPRHTANSITDNDLDTLYTQRDQLADTLREVLSAFIHKTHPGQRCLQTGHINVATVERWRAALNNTPAQPLATPTGDGQ